ncbi:MAG: hypothetical protein H9917_04995 [Candidatus Oceanisphaera merdipullorum]|nr:hypothetical protein [Candidatus Oceanisphaera merdipullorum]
MKTHNQETIALKRDLMQPLMDELIYKAVLKERHIGTAKLNIDMAASFRMGGRRKQATQYLLSAAVHRKYAESHARSLAAVRNQILEACHD